MSDLEQHDHETMHRRTQPRGRVHLAVAVFFLAAGLMNGENLLHKNELMQYGRQRDLAMAITKPLAAASRLTYMNSVRRFFDHLAGRETKP